MANNFTEIMSVVNAGNKMGLSNTITRDYGIPLDLTSIHNTYADAVRYAATDATAYQGQVIAAAGKVYIIVNDSQGDYTYKNNENTEIQEILPIYIKELTQSSTTAAIDERLIEIEKFFKVGDSEQIEATLDTLIEIQNYIAEHGEDFSGVLKDVGENRDDINHIYSRWELSDDGTYKRDANGDRIAKTIPTGELQTEINRAITAEKVIYDADGGGQGKATGKLPDEIRRAKEQEQFILDFLFGKDNVSGTDTEVEGTNVHTPGYVEDLAKKVGTADALINGVLGDFRGEYDEEEGTYQYNTVAQFVKNATSVATEGKLGGVLSSNPVTDIKQDFIEVIQPSEASEDGPYAGQMRVIDLNVNKLYQTEYLVLDGGTAKTGTFVNGEFVPPTNNEAGQTNS